MGIQDRDYYWKDRDRRERKYGSDFSGKGSYQGSSPGGLSDQDRKGAYYNPKTSRGSISKDKDSHRDDWRASQREFSRRAYARQSGDWKLTLGAFLLGVNLTLFGVMIMLNLNADILHGPFQLTKKILTALGVM